MTSRSQNSAPLDSSPFQTVNKERKKKEWRPVGTLATLVTIFFGAPGL